jgi:hypothetical protein
MKCSCYCAGFLQNMARTTKKRIYVQIFEQPLIKQIRNNNIPPPIFVLDCYTCLWSNKSRTKNSSLWRILYLLLVYEVTNNKYIFVTDNLIYRWSIQNYIGNDTEDNIIYMGGSSGKVKCPPYAEQNWIY